MSIDHDMEIRVIEESQMQREAWAKLLPGVPLPRKKDKA